MVRWQVVVNTGNEPSASAEGEEFLHQLRNY
jgi:hypothetical protein